MRIVLCGMMGCGKSTVGGALAKALGWRCVDTDQMIREQYGEIAEIFKSKGEGYFRVLETETVRALIGQDQLVVAVGGGLVLNKENVDLLKTGGAIVYLRAEKETLLGRLQGDTSRPLLAGEDLSSRLDALLAARSGAYESVCDFAVAVDGKTPNEIADEIVEKLGLTGAGV